MLVRLLIVVVVACLALGGASPAFAHTGLVDSRPADGATVERPVRQIELTFGASVELAGDGAELLDASGQPVAASTTVAGPVVTLRLDAPLETGDYGVRWALRSDDAHTVRDSITFAVIADPAAGTAVDARSPDRADLPGGADTTDLAGANGGSTNRAADAPAVGAGSAALAATLNRDPTRWLRVTDTSLRAVFIATAFGLIGTIAFLITVWEGSRRELRMLTRLVARLSIGVVVLVAVQVVVRAARGAGALDGALTELPALLSGPYGAGIALRFAGAVIVLLGLPQLRRTLRLAATIPIAGGSVDVLPSRLRGDPQPRPPARRRWRAAAVTVVGALLLVASFALLRHAATAQERVVASSATVGHVLAGALWAGGLLALSATLAHRRRFGLPLEAGQVAVRFSVLATVGVLLASAAGVALAVLQLDSVAALWTTAYGAALSAKVAVVLVVAGIGAYNHFVVVPMLRRSPDHPIGHRLRRLGLVELSLLAVVVALTSVLVSLGS